MKVKWRNILFAVVMFIVVVLLLDLSRRMEKMDRLDTQLETVAAEATSMMGTQAGLITQIAFATSDAAVEQWAYQDGKWVKPGEHLVEIVGVGSAPTPSAVAPADQPDQTPKWRIWWELFFGNQP